MEGLAISSEGHQLLLAEPCEMLGQRRLAKRHSLAERADRKLALGDEMAQDEEPLLVGERLHEGGRVGRL